MGDCLRVLLNTTFGEGSIFQPCREAWIYLRPKKHNLVCGLKSFVSIAARDDLPQVIVKFLLKGSLHIRCKIHVRYAGLRFDTVSVFFRKTPPDSWDRYPDASEIYLSRHGEEALQQEFLFADAREQDQVMSMSTYYES